jgi:serine/threonine protein kinase
MKYVIESRLGVGGMAEVFRGRQRGAAGFSRPVAIKRMNAALSSDEALAKMFVEEAQTAALLHHPNIVSVFDFDKDESGTLFLAMELVEGADLFRLIEQVRLRGVRFPFGLSLHVAAEALRGLGFAHEFVHEGQPLGIVHRDVSPQNILIGRTGNVKIADFGIAKVTASAVGPHTGGIKGKLNYMAPEQANGLPLDARADLYAVGVILYELLAGARAFAGNTEADLFRKVLNGDVPPLSVRAPDVPADVVAVVGRLMAFDREARFASATVVVEALRACACFPADGAGELSRLMAMLLEPGLGGAPPGSTSSVGSVASAPMTPSPAGAALADPNGPAARTPAPRSSVPSFEIPAGAPPMPRTMVLPAEQVAAAFPSTPQAESPSAPIQRPVDAPVSAAASPPTRPARLALRWIGALAGVSLVAGVVTAGVLRGSSSKGASDSTAAARHVGDAAPPTPGRGIAQAPPAPMAPEAPADAAASPVAPVESPPVPGEAGQPVVPDAPAGSHRSGESSMPGKLVVRVKPWAHVFVDGRAAGSTPISRELSPGKHRVKLVNEDLGKSESVVVTIAAGRELLIERSW